MNKQCVSAFEGSTVAINIHHGKGPLGKQLSAWKRHLSNHHYNKTSGNDEGIRCYFNKKERKKERTTLRDLLP